MLGFDDFERIAPVVLGVGGGPVPRAAALWAADEAALTRRPLWLVSAVGKDDTAPRLSAVGSDGRPRHVRTPRADRLRALADARRLAAGRHRGLDIHTRLVEGAPGEVLEESAKDAAMLVVGARPPTPGYRHRAAAESRLMDGLLSHEVSCPVALVRNSAVPLETQSPTIVVGVGGDSSCDAALEYAFEEAKRRRAKVLAATTALPSPPWGTTWSRADLTAAAIRLQDEMRSWRAEFPEVPTRLEILAGAPSWTLAEASADALCLVIGGDRGYGCMDGPPRGSVERALLRRAVCPLVVVGSSSDEPRTRRTSQAHESS